jgi:hypothetical protein
MAKRRLNGNLKWIVVAVSLAGIGFLVMDKVMYLGAVDAAVKDNVAKDEKDHAKFDETTQQVKMVIVGIQKDISQTQKDVGQIAEGQEMMNKKLDDLFILQLTGPAK